MNYVLVVLMYRSTGTVPGLVPVLVQHVRHWSRTVQLYRYVLYRTAVPVLVRTVYAHHAILVVLLLLVLLLLLHDTILDY